MLRHKLAKCLGLDLIPFLHLIKTREIKSYTVTNKMTVTAKLDYIELLLVITMNTFGRSLKYIKIVSVFVNHYLTKT